MAEVRDDEFGKKVFDSKNLPLADIQYRGYLERCLASPIDLPNTGLHTPGSKQNCFSLSEKGSSLRRWLARTGQGFAKILLYTRLERGLSLLQTSEDQVSQIALECGFKTPSHFSDAFRKRFGIKPKDVRIAAD